MTLMMVATSALTAFPSFIFLSSLVLLLCAVCVCLVCVFACLFVCRCVMCLELNSFIRQGE